MVVAVIVTTDNGVEVIFKVSVKVGVIHSVSTGVKVVRGEIVSVETFVVVTAGTNVVVDCTVVVSCRTTTSIGVVVVDGSISIVVVTVMTSSDGVTVVDGDKVTVDVVWLAAMCLVRVMVVQDVFETTFVLVDRGSFRQLHACESFGLA